MDGAGPGLARRRGTGDGAGALTGRKPSAAIDGQSEGDEKVRVLKLLLRDESGATAIEYGLIAALIAIAAIAAFQRLGLNLAAIFETIAAALGG